MKVKILQTERNWFNQSIWIQALEDCEMCFNSLLGRKKMLLPKEKIKKIKISKELFFKVGEEYGFNQVCNCKTGNQFDWTWV